MEQEDYMIKARRYLWEGIVTGNTKNVRDLLTKMAIPVNDAITAIGTRPLHQAVLSRRPEIVKELVENYKADINITDNNLRTPLHFAALSGDLEMIEYLISRGANKDAQTIGKETPSMKAAMAGEESSVDELVFRYKCDVNIPNAAGKTLLDIYKIYYGKTKHEAFVKELKSAKILIKEDLKNLDSDSTVIEDTTDEDKKGK